jgi:prepilin-type N-terminal cleavage/methylation domain-containing protein
MRRTVRRERGFTLTELMVVIVIIGVLSMVVIFGAKRPLADTQLDAAANNFRWTLMTARNRAQASHNPFFVDVSPTSGYRFCQAKADLSDCDPGQEISPWIRLGDKVVADSYALATNVGPGTTTAFGTTAVRLVVYRNSSIDADLANPMQQGFTLYLRTNDGAKQRKAYVWALTGQIRVVDKW